MISECHDIVAASSCIYNKTTPSECQCTAVSEGGPPVFLFFFISTSRMKTDNVLLTVLRHSGNVNSSYHYGESKTKKTGWCGVEEVQGLGGVGGGVVETGRMLQQSAPRRQMSGGAGWGVDIRRAAGESPPTHRVVTGWLRMQVRAELDTHKCKQTH